MMLPSLYAIPADRLERARIQARVRVCRCVAAGNLSTAARWRAVEDGARRRLLQTERAQHAGQDLADVYQPAGAGLLVVHGASVLLEVG